MDVKDYQDKRREFGKHPIDRLREQNTTARLQVNHDLVFEYDSRIRERGRFVEFCDSLNLTGRCLASVSARHMLPTDPPRTYIVRESHGPMFTSEEVYVCFVEPSLVRLYHGTIAKVEDGFTTMAICPIKTFGP